MTHGTIVKKKPGESDDQLTLFAAKLWRRIWDQSKRKHGAEKPPAEDTGIIKKYDEVKGDEKKHQQFYGGV